MKICKLCKVNKPMTEFKHHTAQCKPCRAIKRHAYYEAHKEEIAAYDAQKWIKNKIPYSKRMQKYKKENPEIVNAINRKWAKANPAKKNALVAKRKAAKLQRIPKWLTILDKEKIQEYYDYAHLISETLNVKHDVDHIIPLQGDNISGLHCPENLQILTSQENNSKGNKWPYYKD